MEQILTKISKFPEILGELGMCKWCPPSSSFSTHAQEPGEQSCTTRWRLTISIKIENTKLKKHYSCWILSGLFEFCYGCS